MKLLFLVSIFPLRVQVPNFVSRAPVFVGSFSLLLVVLLLFSSAPSLHITIASNAEPDLTETPRISESGGSWAQGLSTGVSGSPHLPLGTSAMKKQKPCQLLWQLSQPFVFLKGKPHSSSAFRWRSHFCLPYSSLLFRRQVMFNSLQPWGLRTAARQASLSFTVSWSLLKLGSMMSAMPSNHPIFCRPLLFSSCPQSLPASGSFPGSWLFTPGGQSIGASVSASVLCTWH